MRQEWRNVVFLHWEVDPGAIRGLYPADVEPDVIDGRTYVGLVGLHIRVALLGVVPVPYLGRFAEVNVRLYSVDRAGRRGIVFRSLDAGRLAPTLAARELYRLPYCWWDGAVRRQGDVVSYAGRRRWPGGGPTTRFAVRVGEPIGDPTPLEHFLTARWTLHWSAFGRTLWCAAAHEQWPLHRAELIQCSDELVAAACLPVAAGPPTGVHYAPGVSATIGAPHRV